MFSFRVVGFGSLFDCGFDCICYLLIVVVCIECCMVLTCFDVGELVVGVTWNGCLLVCDFVGLFGVVGFVLILR